MAPGSHIIAYNEPMRVFRAAIIIIIFIPHIGFPCLYWILIGIATVFLIFAIINSNPQVSKFVHMKLYSIWPFSYPPKHFVGRDEDMKELIASIDFSNKTSQIICIIGPPGIGKSALAFSVGHEMILNGAV